MFITIFIFIAILTILILVHEFGHFITAKWAGARVEEFGIGFPPRVFGLKKGETLYSVNLLPIGGFVKIYGEDGDKKNDTRSFASKPLRVRSSIIAAGVLMNIVLSVVLLSFGHFIGLPQVIDGSDVSGDISNIVVRIAAIAQASPAHEAGIRVGDVIDAMQSEGMRLDTIQTIENVQEFTSGHIGKSVLLSMKRGGEVFEKTVVPRADPPTGEGAIGIAMIRTGQVSYPWYRAPLKGAESTFFLVRDTVKAFATIIMDYVSTGALTEELAGPIGIAVITGQVQQLGFIFLLQFIALISINLAIINILPFPALDGGRLLFLAIEKLKGSPVNQKYEKFAHTVGFALIILLMILVTFRDIGRFL